MIRYFSTSYLPQYIALALVLIALWTDTFISATVFPDTGSLNPLYLYLSNWFADVPILRKMISIAIVYMEALLLNAILTQNSLSDKNSLLPAFIYCILLSAIPEYCDFMPLIPANLFMIFFLYYIFHFYKEEADIQSLFNAGLCIAIASMFHFYYLLFFIVLLMALMIYSAFRWRNWVIPFAGIFIPYFILFSLWYVFELRFPQWEAYLNVFSAFKQISWNFTLPIILFGIFFLFLLLSSSLKLISSMLELNISVRKKVQIVLWMLLVGLILLLYIDHQPAANFGFIAVTSPALIALFLGSKKKLFWYELIFAAIFLSLIWRYF
jgi:hypothetical protein